MGVLRRKQPAPSTSPSRVERMSDPMLFTFVEASLMEALMWLSKHNQGQEGAAALARDSARAALQGLEELTSRG